MKKIQLLFILLVSSINLYSQNYEPIQRKVIYDTDTIYAGADSTRFQQKGLIRGWHWGSGKSITKSSFGNQEHVNYINDDLCTHADELADSIYLMINAPFISSWNSYTPLLSQSMKFEPTLLITSPYGNTKRANDPSNAVFGFQKINGVISSNPSDTNYNRLKLLPNLHQDSLVLSEPWICNQFRYLGGNDNAQPYNYYDFTGTIKDFNSLELYCTINLRNLNPTNIQDTSKVLAIKMPYTTEYDSVYYAGDTLKVAAGGKRHTKGSIMFSYIPINNNTSFNTINGRGKFQNLESIVPDSVFYITRNMLPTGSDRDITISAKFICDGDFFKWVNPNPHFKPGNGTHNDRLIDSLKIEVVYLGGDSLAIDWIKIESKVAQDLSKGVFDNALVHYVDTALHHFTKSAFKAKGVKPYRFYTVDEHGDPWIWGNFRYINKLMGNIFTTEINPPYQDLFNYYVNPPDFIHSLAYQDPYFIPAPFVHQGEIHYGGTGNRKNYSVMGHKWGYNLYGNGDVLNSDYETYFDDWAKPRSLKYFRDTASITEYLSVLSGVNSLQGSLEKSKYHGMYSPEQGNFLYQNKNWNAWGYVSSNWGFSIYYDTLKAKMDTTAVGGRPFTGEELSAWMWSAIGMGAKGFVLDKEQNGPTYPRNWTTGNSPWTAVGLGNGQEYYDSYNLSRLDNHSFLYSDSVGGDFLNLQGDSTLLNKYVELDYVRDSMLCLPNRIYIGRKSIRTTLGRIYSYLKCNDSYLMDLKLQAAMTKGFKVLKTHHPDLDSNFIDKYIDTKKIRVKKLYQPDSNAVYHKQYQYELEDSTFYDLSILKQGAKSTDTSFTVALVNRRTNSQIIVNIESDPDFQQVYFATSAEFEKGVLSGDTIYPYSPSPPNLAFHKDTSWWRSMWDRKHGNREITIPFNFKLQSDTNKYCLLHVKELYDTSSYAVSLRNATNTKLIDTVIGQDSPLAITLQPGQGTFLKCDVLEPQKNIVGELDYSNQNKMVIWKESYGTNLYSYHIAYYKEDIVYYYDYGLTTIQSTLSTDTLRYKAIRNRVYYARSQATNGQTDMANISWYGNRPISDDIFDGSNYRDKLDCAYPSIVVRKDSINNKLNAYIVYQCNDTIPDAASNSSLKIVETIISCNGGTSVILSSKQIGFSNHDQNKNHNNYANPVINASKDGNFYSWSSQYGIISSFKKPEDYYFTTYGFDTIGVKNVGEGCSTMDFQHPSLNPYSIMFNANSVKNENQASLVFQGSNCMYGDNSYIYFSRLKLDSNNKVKHYQVDNTMDSYLYPKGSAFYYLDSGRTVRFHWGARQGKLPSVYRSLKSTLFRYEVIAWERRYYDNVSQIFALNILDLNQSNSSNLVSWKVNSVAHLSPVGGFGNDDAGKPVLGNPTEIDRTDYFNPKVRGEAVLNFTWGDKIYHTPLNSNSLITDTTFVDESKALRSIKYVAKGMLPHLMNGPIQLADSSVWQNRRIYNTLDSVHHITSSARYYYFKKNEVGDEINSSYGFANDTTFLMMTKAKLNDYDLHIKQPILEP